MHQFILSFLCGAAREAEERYYLPATFRELGANFFYDIASEAAWQLEDIL